MVNSKHSIQIIFCKKVRDLRIKRGYSQEAFAFECGVSLTAVGQQGAGGGTAFRKRSPLDSKNLTVVNSLRSLPV